MAFVKVIAYLEVDDENIDTGPRGPLTQAAYERVTRSMGGFEDIEFEEDDR